MDYKKEIIIKKDLRTVWSAFTDFNRFKSWHEGLKSMEHIEGEVGRPGAVRMLTYEKKDRVTAVKETILKREDPYTITIIYVNDNKTNLSHHYFEEMPNGSTHMITEAKFEIRGWQKYFSFFHKRNLAADVLRMQKSFKKWVESSF